MISLRQFFLVEKLRLAVSSKSTSELKITREIIKEIKLYQLDKKTIATDNMVVEVIENILEKKQTEICLVLKYLHESRQYIAEKKD